CRPVLRSYQERLSSSVTTPSCTIRLPERSSGSASPRFSRHRRTRAASSLPMMTRASEPPMKELRLSYDFLQIPAFILSAPARRVLVDVIYDIWRIMRQEQKPLTNSQIRAARALLGWTANELSRQSAVSLRTIQRAELQETSMTAANDLAVRRSLEAAGVEFID